MKKKEKQNKLDKEELKMRKLMKKRSRENYRKHEYSRWF